MSCNTALVTGAGGFIGSHLVRHLIARGQDVHVVLRPTTKLRQLEDVVPCLTIHRVDLADTEGLALCVRRASPTQVFHLAAETRGNSKLDFDAARRTITGCQSELINLVESLADLPQPPSVFVRAGTIAEYGSAAVPYIETQRERPTTPYGAGMTASTRYLEMLEDILPFPAITARLALVYGPGQSERFLLPGLIRACLEGRRFEVHHPESRRDLIYIQDVVEALLLLSQLELTKNRIFNIATNIAPTMREVAHTVLNATGADPALLEIRDLSEAKPQSELRASADLAHRILRWKARTRLSDGVVQTVAALQSETQQEGIQ